MVPPRLIPLLERFDFACQRLADRMAGPAMDSGDGAETEVSRMTDEEYFWEPVQKALLSVEDSALDTVGYCTYPHGSDADEPLIDIVWWVNQEVLHHGAEIALMRDLYFARHR
ncbi:hypothetical protein ACQUSR_29495 [Streptomyces sp. P1-3]|uniref:hypothetical protein n=1 Tax=Streptomyces sp. P1-3 TaxID=3421658 RepID=UPI003D36A58F